MAMVSSLSRAFIFPPQWVLFPFFKDIGGHSFKVTLADYVSLESGSGVVHSAPAFGADDAETGNKYGAPVVNPVDLEGKFTDAVPPLAGMWVKDADKKIIRNNALRFSAEIFKEKIKTFIDKKYSEHINK